MSRWVTNFESHGFHSSWENLLEKVNEINEKEITDNSLQIEISRLKKVIEYIDKYIKIIDPDINITSFTNNLNNFNQYIINTTNEVNNFVLNHYQLTYIQRANNNIDNCLSVIQPLNTILPKVSGQGIYSMLKKYNETLERSLSELDLGQAIDSSMKIKELKQTLLDGTDYEESIKYQIESMLRDTEEKHEKLVEFYNDTLNDTGYNETTKELIENAKEEVLSNLKTTKENISELSNKIESFDKFYIKIFGELNDENERIGGLKSELEKRIQTLDSFEEEQQKTHKETLESKNQELNNYLKEQQLHTKNLFEQIESLLPSATSAGLAKAYHEERKKFAKPIANWNITFVVSLILISLLSFFTMQDVEKIEDVGKSILHTLPVTGSLIWLAIYASKRRSENQRLEQEYAHKEALANSYSSYKQQIESLNQADQELLVKLLDSAIDTISTNASESLDKKHGEVTPLQEMMKTIVLEIKNLKKG